MDSAEPTMVVATTSLVGLMLPPFSTGWTLSGVGWGATPSGASGVVGIACFATGR
jgi:hypothetical protein